MKPSISGVIITPLKIIKDERGAVMHMLRSDDPHFDSFGEVYFSLTGPKNIKAWKRHNRMTLNIAVPAGRVQFVIYDDRSHSLSLNRIDKIILGPDDQYVLVTVPPMVWTGFQNIGLTDAIIANCANIPHNPNEADHLDLNDSSFKFNWKK